MLQEKLWTKQQSSLESIYLVIVDTSRTSLECWDFSKFLKEGKKILWELEKNYIPGTGAKHNKMANGFWNKNYKIFIWRKEEEKVKGEEDGGRNIYMININIWLPQCISIYLNPLTSITFLTNFSIHKHNTLKLKISQWFSLEGNSCTVRCQLVNIYSPF